MCLSYLNFKTFYGIKSTPLHLIDLIPKQESSMTDKYLVNDLS